MRLHDIQHTYGDQVQIHWRAYPLLAENRPGRRSTQHTRDSRQRAGVEEPQAQFALPEVESELPASSIPALTAAKCAEQQGTAVFNAFHQGLFVAHFRDNLDISRPNVLWRLAQESGLDMARFQHDYASGKSYQAVLHDYAEAVAWFGVSVLPTVIFNEKVSLVGAVPVEQYRLLLDWMLAGAPGGLIPLDFSAPAAGAAGQSTVG